MSKYRVHTVSCNILTLSKRVRTSSNSVARAIRFLSESESWERASSRRRVASSNAASSSYRLQEKHMLQIRYIYQIKTNIMTTNKRMPKRFSHSTFGIQTNSADFNQTRQNAVSDQSQYDLVD